MITFALFNKIYIFDMKLKYFALIILLFYSMNTKVYSQPLKIMTYNVENLFDTRHDTLKNDMEFLPNSERHWTNKRYYDKIQDIMQVIVGVGGWNNPVLVGLCEIENKNVLDAMVKHTPYNQLGYDYVHFEGPDKRGIDVALLYQKDLFMPLLSYPIPVTLPNDKQGRDLLYVSGQFYDGTIVHIFQIHFPSRREGALFSEPNRIAAAQVLLENIDSIRQIDPKAGIIVMGDFNDTPIDYVPSRLLNALPYNITSNYENNQLYNLTWDGRMYKDFDEGTYFHKGAWDMLDQIIVSGSLLNGTYTTKLNNRANIYKPKWISEYNKKQHKNVPFRTYVGPFYHGGVSDHFPISVDIVPQTK